MHCRRDWAKDRNIRLHLPVRIHEVGVAGNAVERVTERIAERIAERVTERATERAMEKDNGKNKKKVK